MNKHKVAALEEQLAKHNLPDRKVLQEGDNAEASKGASQEAVLPAVGHNAEASKGASQGAAPGHAAGEDKAEGTTA